MEANGLPRAVVSRIEALPLPKQRQDLERWMRELRANGLSEKTLELYSSHLKVLGCAIQKPFDKLTRDDLVSYIGNVKNPGSRNSVGTTVRGFLKWMHAGTVPPSMSWWKPSKIDLTLDAEDILTEMEIQKMIAHAATLRDKALISVLYDSGARIASILSLRQMDIKELEGEQRGLVIHLRSDKTGKRRILIVNSVPVLKDHLNGLADKRPESRIWFTHDGRPLGYQGGRDAIKAAGRLAKISKPVRPHMLRHARITECARQKISAFAADAQFGWVPGSSMYQRYVHLTGGDTDREILRVSGVQMKDEGGTESPLRPINCPLCAKPNDRSMSYCTQCGGSLLKDAKTLADEITERSERTLRAYANVIIQLVAQKTPEEQAKLTPEQLMEDVPRLTAAVDEAVAKERKDWLEKHPSKAGGSQ